MKMPSHSTEDNISWKTTSKMKSNNISTTTGPILSKFES
jgi:hypothetical protein